MTNKRYKNLAFSLCLSIIISACSYQQMNEEYPNVNNVKVNEKFRITLPEDHSTGYVWQMQSIHQNEVLHYKGSVFRGSVKGVDFNFEALHEGKDTLQFSLIKYKDTISTKKFVIEVKP